MPRSGAGTYTLPESPFVSNTPISSSAVNSDLDDIADALTDSLSRSGDGAMSAQFQAIAGDESDPGISFSVDPDTGLFRKAANVLGVAVDGAEVANFSDDGLDLVVGSLSLNGVPIFPIGVPFMWILTTLPSADYLWIDGSAVTTAHAALRTALLAASSPYGVSGSDPLLPDWRGRSPFGRDDMGGTATNRITNAVSGIVGTTLGAVGGAQSVVLDTTMIPAHTHAGTTGGNSVSHTHGVVIPGTSNSGAGSKFIVGDNSGSATITVTSGLDSPGHSHDFTTGVTGGGLAHRNMPPAAITNFIIRGR